MFFYTLQERSKTVSTFDYMKSIVMYTTFFREGVKFNLFKMFYLNFPYGDLEFPS